MFWRRKKKWRKNNEVIFDVLIPVRLSMISRLQKPQNGKRTERKKRRGGGCSTCAYLRILRNQVVFNTFAWCPFRRLSVFFVPVLKPLQKPFFLLSYAFLTYWFNTFWVWLRVLAETVFQFATQNSYRGGGVHFCAFVHMSFRTLVHSIYNESATCAFFVSVVHNLVHVWIPELCTTFEYVMTSLCCEPITTHSIYNVSMMCNLCILVHTCARVVSYSGASNL